MPPPCWNKATAETAGMHNHSTAQEIKEELVAQRYGQKDLEEGNGLCNFIESILAERYGVDESDDEQYEKFHKLFIEAL